MRSLLIVLILCGTWPAAALAARWTIQPDTVVQVDADWRGQTVTVHFPSYAGRVDFDEKNLGSATATISIATGDATAGLAVVDQILRSGDFLAAKQFPQITFYLDRLTQTSASTADVAGRVTLRGVTRPVQFKATVIRYGPDPADPSQFLAGFDVTGAIDRTEFGSTGGLPDIAARLGLHMRLMMERE